MAGPAWTRRDFLAGSAVACGSLALVPAVLKAAAGSPIVLDATTASAQLLDAGEPRTPIWGYNGLVPGPLIRVKPGEQVRVRLRNSLAEATTIHWHGIRNRNDMDGVPGLTQEPVQPNDSFDYVFAPPDSGTYWYHPHLNSGRQLARGLYGMLIVEEAAPILVDQDLALIFDDWRIRDSGEIAPFGGLHNKAHAGRLGNILTLNGNPYTRIPVRSGERLRLRLLNAANSRILKLSFGELSPRIVAVDGQPIAPKSYFDGPITLAPAQRMDVVIDMLGAPGREVPIGEVSRGQVEIAKFVWHKSETARKEPLAAPIELPPNRLAEPRIDDAVRVPLVLAGGAMGRLSRAVFQGEEMSLRQLAREKGMVWALNGVADMPSKPLVRVPQGRTIVVQMRNDTRWPHAMHVHGHHFRVIKRGVGAIDPYWWDTILVQPGEAMDIAFVADNPGRWMLHCHMMEHHESGMCTWYEVLDPKAPAASFEEQLLRSICRGGV